MLEPAGFSSQAGAAEWVVNPFLEAMTPPRIHKLPSRSASPPSVSSFPSLQGQVCSFPKCRLPWRIWCPGWQSWGKEHFIISWPREPCPRKYFSHHGQLAEEVQGKSHTHR